MLDIQLQNGINTIDYNTTFLPIIMSRIKNNSLYDEINNYVPLIPKYKDILLHIEKNIINNGLNGASITIQLPKQKKLTCNSKKNKRTLKNMDKWSLHQLYINIVDDRNKTDNELMELARNSGYEIFMVMKTNHLVSINLIDSVCEVNFIHCIMEGLMLSAYNFFKYKTKLENKDNFIIKKINISSIECVHLDISSILKKKEKLKNLLIEIECVFMARDIINEPANMNKTKFIIDTMQDKIKKNKLPIVMDILDDKDLNKEGLNLILGVGQGSNMENKPKMVILKYNGNEKNDPDYVLLGKGITYDTGGLDLKKKMLDMKTDLSGATTVMSFLIGYARMKGDKNIYVVCPFAENSIGPNSIKPGDIIKSYSGKTVEVTDTDAEGRLILADALSWCVKKWKNAQYIDFATLTGQQESLSCKVFSNIMGSNSDVIIKKIIEDGEKINEPLVYLPLFEDKFINKLDSKVADIKNVSSQCNADLILSTIFMKQFIDKSTKWIHIDFAGPIYKLSNDSKNKYMIGEASGIGVRLLFEFFDCY